MTANINIKLKNLLKLQTIDSRIFDIKKIRGALPDEVQDLEDELIGYGTRLENHIAGTKNLNNSILDLSNKILEAKKLVKKYKSQQLNVRNNREYDAISKEIEVQELDVKIFQKKSKETEEKIELEKTEEMLTKKKIRERKKDLTQKKNELETILLESKEEEDKLSKEKTKSSKKIENTLLLSYNKLVKRQRNGLAVVIVKRGACGGCFNVVPPQRQTEIKEKKKIILCEYCGRILADVEEEVFEDKPKKKITKKKITKKKITKKKITKKKITKKKRTKKVK